MKQFPSKVLFYDFVNSSLDCYNLVHTTLFVCTLFNSTVFAPIDEVNQDYSNNNKSSSKATNIREFQQSIAQMDAQISRLSLICNDIHRNYDQINRNIANNDSPISASQSISNSKYHRLLEYAQDVENKHKLGQIDNIRAWELLSDIHNELNLTRQAMNHGERNDTHQSQRDRYSSVNYSILHPRNSKKHD